MINQIINFFEWKFENYTCTLSDLSKDDKGVAISNLEKIGFNFDNIVKELNSANSKKKLFCTPDAIVFNDRRNEIIFIEFKNRETKSKERKKKKCSINTDSSCECFGDKVNKELNQLRNKELEYGVRLKALEGFLAFCKILIKHNIIANRTELYTLTIKYIVVYSAEKNPKLVEIRKAEELQVNVTHRERYDCKEMKSKVIFELERYKDILYSDVLTTDSVFFDKEYSQIFS